MGSKSHYIGGRWVEGEGSEFTSVDPATGEVTWRGRAATEAQVDCAVRAAQGAFESWAETPLGGRIGLLRVFSERLAGHRQDLAETISRDTGKPLWESLAEVAAMIGKVDLSIQAYQERCREVERDISGARGMTRYKPHGVCAVLGPFNLPGHLPNGHIVPAVLAGNAVVLKPSEQAAAVGQKVLEIWEEAGAPAGLINMVQGGAEVGVALAGHGGIDGVFFTGSSAVGLALSRGLAERPWKILALEMGGNNPLIVWEASDLGAAAYTVVQSAYITAGQRCTCARRLIVPEGRQGEAIVERVVEMMGRVRVGRWTDRPEVFMGPVISVRAAERMLAAQERLIAAGATVIVKMGLSGGCGAMLTPGLLDVTGVGDRLDEELFGPLLQLIRVRDFEGALAEANRTRYGLVAGLLSDRAELYELFYRKIRAGVVSWNRPTTGASGGLPFGGVGASGNHRPSGYFAADYCSYPVASIEVEALRMPERISPGIDV